MAKHKHKRIIHHHHIKRVIKIPKSFAWITGGVVLLIVLSIFANYSISDQKMDKPTYIQEAQQLSDPERKQIDQWIIDNNLNKFGDPRGTVYVGGTPLFDEATGKYKDLYEYILERHPDKPWLP